MIEGLALDSFTKMKQFQNTRAKVTRVDSSEEFYAWVVPSPDHLVMLNSEGTPELQTGESVVLMLNGNGASTTLETKYEGNNNGCHVFRLPHLVRIETPKEQARKRLDLPKATVEGPEGSFQATIVDVSKTGLGILTNESYETDTLIMVRLHHSGADINIEGKVIYSRFETDEQSSFRTGITIQRMNRIDQARYNQLLAS